MKALLLLISLFIYQTNLTDTDKVQILSLLFQPQEHERTILLSPRTDPGWLLNLPGIHFQQLKYGEEKQVAEYYELENIKVRRDYVELSISKGNYCNKAGTAYEFRKKEGKWTARVTGTLESRGGTGSVCTACKIGTAQPARSKEPPERKDLVLTGNVLATRCKRGEDKYIGCEVDLSLEFISQGSQPAIILQPYGEYEFWHGADSLALTKADSEAFNYVYSVGAWPSVYRFEKYYLLARKLDQATPPADVTRVLAPGESWKWKTTIGLRFNEENTCDGSSGVEIGWSELKKLSAPLWLKVSYEMWPTNVENFSKGLGGKLRERWKKHGTLYLEEKSYDRWFAHLTSEPIALNFQSIELR